MPQTGTAAERSGSQRRGHRPDASGQYRSGAVERSPAGDVQNLRHYLRHRRQYRGRSGHRPCIFLRRKLWAGNAGQHFHLPRDDRSAAVSELDSPVYRALERFGRAAGRHGAAVPRHMAVYEKRPWLRPAGRTDGGAGPQNPPVGGRLPRRR